MGTNYYLQRPVDKAVIDKIFEEAKDYFVSQRTTCMSDLEDSLKLFNSIHLGKRGSTFTFACHDWKYFKNIEEFEEFLATGEIVDEYGEKFSTEEFINLAKKANNSKINKHHALSWPECIFIKFNRLWSKREFS